jgi:PAS domain S-box-containing protein
VTEYRIAENQIEELHKKIREMDKQLHEIMEERLTENARKESTLEILPDQEFDYMLIFDENAKIIDCTNDIQKKLGYNKQEMLSRTFADVVYLESFDDIKADLEEIKKLGSMQSKNIHRKKDGSSVFVSEHIKYLKDRNMFICMVKEDEM